MRISIAAIFAAFSLLFATSARSQEESDPCSKVAADSEIYKDLDGLARSDQLENAFNLRNAEADSDVDDFLYSAEVNLSYGTLGRAADQFLNTDLEIGSEMTRIVNESGSHYGMPPTIYEMMQNTSDTRGILSTGRSIRTSFQQDQFAGISNVGFSTGGSLPVNRIGVAYGGVSVTHDFAAGENYSFKVTGNVDHSSGTVDLFLNMAFRDSSGNIGASAREYAGTVPLTKFASIDDYRNSGLSNRQYDADKYVIELDDNGNFHTYKTNLDNTEIDRILSKNSLEQLNVQEGGTITSGFGYVLNDEPITDKEAEEIPCESAQGANYSTLIYIDYYRPDQQCGGFAFSITYIQTLELNYDKWRFRAIQIENDGCGSLTRTTGSIQTILSPFSP